jgi:hypothetical protein
MVTIFNYGNDSGSHQTGANLKGHGLADMEAGRSGEAPNGKPRPVTANGWAASHMLACGGPHAHWTRSSQSFGERSEQGQGGVGRRLDSRSTLCVLSASASSAYVFF